MKVEVHEVNQIQKILSITLFPKCGEGSEEDQAAAKALETVKRIAKIGISTRDDGITREIDMITIEVPLRD